MLGKPERQPKRLFGRFGADERQGVAKQISHAGTSNKPTTQVRVKASSTLATCTMNGKISPVDWRLVPADPDSDFSEEHNRRVIEESIVETDRIQKKKRADYDEKVGERIDAVARFIERVKMGVGSSDVKSYFGKRMLEYLQGNKIGVIKRQHVPKEK